MSEPSDFRWLYRYTSLASALDIVTTGEITLLSPSVWQDRNDTHYLEQFQRSRGYRSVFALCFTKAAETSHHWSNFASGADGVRLLFNWDRLQRDLELDGGAVLREVEYCKLDRAVEFRHRPNDWPFLKRHPYRGEEEVRALYCSENGSELSKRFRLSEGTLLEVVLSPNLPPSLQGTVTQTIRNSSVWGNLKIYRSTLFANDRWINAVWADDENPV